MAKRIKVKVREKDLKQKQKVLVYPIDSKQIDVVELLLQLKIGLQFRVSVHIDWFNKLDIISDDA